MPKPPLTKRQRQILDFFSAYNAAHGMSPTLEEAATHFGVNKVTIFGHVSELERKGVFTRAGRRVSRGVQIVSQSGASASTSVPILGKIAAGLPIQAVEEAEEFQLADLIPQDRQIYALRVSGQSMIDDGIRDGDIVLVEGRSEARDGEMVVAVLPDEETTLKRIYREKKGFRLQPANPDMDPIFVQELTVRGVVIGVVRRF